MRIAKILSKWGRDIHITLIDKNNYHTYYPDLYEVATANIPEVFGHLKINFYELMSTASFHFEDIFLNDLNVTFLRDEIKGVDFQKKEILLKNSESRSYDILVIGAGSETNYFNIPGLQENSIPLKSFAEALNVRNAIDELFANSPKNHAIKIIVGGGGFTGCEFAGELMGFIKRLSKIHGRPKNLVECSIIEASPSLLGGAGLATQKKAKKRLLSLGINLMLNSPIKSVEQKNVILQDGSKHSFDLLVWTGGARANDLAKSLSGVQLEKASCLMMDSHLKILPYDNVFGVGDMTYCLDKKTGRPMPMTASVAIREAKFAAENIKRLILKKSLLDYKPHFAGLIVPLGEKYAILETHGLVFAGFFPWVLKNLISIHYFSTILDWPRAFKVWYRGLKIFVKND